MSLLISQKVHQMTKDAQGFFFVLRDCLGKEIT